MGAVQVSVALGARTYPVVVERGDYASLGSALEAAGVGPSLAVITDDRVGPLWLDAALSSLQTGGREVEVVHTFPAGEEHKTLDTWARAVQALLEARAHRRTTVVALGGGVVGDVAGFVAATLLRGVPLVQLPTTLLAMVDSSVGGKTGVNVPTGKNLVGAFHQPLLVYAALDTLSTLEPVERVAGLGEVVKTALLGDAALLARLEAESEALRAGEGSALAPVVGRCVEIKAEVVAADEREAGLRAVLNAGHTVGHAVETALGHGRIRHGEAVALGLVAEARWAVRQGLCKDPALPSRLQALCRSLGLPWQLPALPTRALVRAALLDKKRIGDRLTLPVPVHAGEMRLVQVPLAELPEFFEVP